MGLVMPPIKVQYSSKLMRPSWLASRFWMSLSAAFRFPVSWGGTGVRSAERGRTQADPGIGAGNPGAEPLLPGREGRGLGGVRTVVLGGQRLP